MTPDHTDPVQALLGHIEYLETMSTCLGLLASNLRDEGKHVAAEALTRAIREQRIQVMLVQGQLAAELGTETVMPLRPPTWRNS